MLLQISDTTAIVFEEVNQMEPALWCLLAGGCLDHIPDHKSLLQAARHYLWLGKVTKIDLRQEHLFNLSLVPRPHPLMRKEIAQWSPDPFPCERVGSGHETSLTWNQKVDRNVRYQILITFL